MNVNEMTVAECCDWLAVNVKKCRRNFAGSGFRQDCPWIGPGPSDLWDTHPVPATLDAIDAATPEGWRMVVEQAGDTWYGWAGQIGANRWGCCCTRAPTRLLCESRLRVAMWIEENKA